MTSAGERVGPVGLLDHELSALVGLVRILVGLDRRFSGDEADAISGIALEVGEDNFWRHMQASYEQSFDLQAVLEAAAKVERQQAHSAIYACLADLAASDSIDLAERGLLTRLEQLWQLELAEVE